MTSELLVTFIVALIVFGPKKLPLLAQHLGLLVRQYVQLKQHIVSLWQQVQLQENQRKATEADKKYLDTQ